MPFITIAQDKPEGESIEVPVSATIFDIYYLMQWAQEQYAKSRDDGAERAQYYIDKIKFMVYKL